MLRNKKFILFFFIIYTASVEAQTIVGKFSVKVTDSLTGNLTACNFHLKNDSGKLFFPDTTLVWKDSMGNTFSEFPTEGSFSIDLPYGNYFYEADKGPEFLIDSGWVTINKPQARKNIQLRRIKDMQSLHWWPADLHVHRPVPLIPLLMKAANLFVAPVITSWNEHYPQVDARYDSMVKTFDNNRFYTISASEDERAGGALLYLNLPKPLYFDKRTPDSPSLTSTIDSVSQSIDSNRMWIDIDKPYWMDVPVFLSTGKVNSTGIANNHMHKRGILDGEAWGKTRDKNKYPAPWGNGFWTQDVYYHMLNAGLKVVPSGGSASGVLPNSVGYNRVYAHVPGELTYEKWWASMKKGNVFVTNGPLLLCTANGQLPGSVLRSSSGTTINLSASIFSRDPIDSVQVIRDGKVIKSIPSTDMKNDKIDVSIKANKSGWFLLRVLCKNKTTFRFASTAPFYVEIGRQPQRISRSSVQFFIDWLNQRSADLKKTKEKVSEDTWKYMEAAQVYWNKRMQLANSE